MLSKKILILLYSISISQSKYVVILKNNIDIFKYKNLNKFSIGEDFNGIITEDIKLINKKDIKEINNDQEINLDDPDEDNKINKKNTYQWGLDRIDQTNLPLNNKYIPSNDASKTTIYVLDTGCKKTHKEFENRVVYGYTHYGSNAIDNQGHGTHVMSTVLGKNVGVAKKAKGICVKILNDNGSGTISGVIKGIEWSVKHAKNNNYCAIISMSLGGSKNNALNNAVTAAIKSGVPVVVASGNSNTNSCLFSPSSATNVISVGSSDKNDNKSYFSNYGKCNNIFAPGTSILGADYRNNNKYSVKSGTSMACPHVSGSLAMFLHSNNCNVKLSSTFINDMSKNNAINNVPNGNNNLIQIQNIPSTSPTPNPSINCLIQCNSIKNKCKCLYNNYIENNNCTCIWKKRRRKRKCFLK